MRRTLTTLSLALALGAAAPVGTIMAATGDPAGGQTGIDRPSRRRHVDDQGSRLRDGRGAPRHSRLPVHRRARPGDGREGHRPGDALPPRRQDGHREADPRGPRRQGAGDLLLPDARRGGPGQARRVRAVRRDEALQAGPPLRPGRPLQGEARRGEGHDSRDRDARRRKGGDFHTRLPHARPEGRGDAVGQRDAGPGRDEGRGDAGDGQRLRDGEGSGDGIVLQREGEGEREQRLVGVRDEATRRKRARRAGILRRTVIERFGPGRTGGVRPRAEWGDGLRPTRLRRRRRPGRAPTIPIRWPRWPCDPRLPWPHCGSGSRRPTRWRARRGPSRTRWSPSVSTASAIPARCSARTRW